MHERPQAALFKALRELGYRVESENGNDKLPARIYGEGRKVGDCAVSVEESSQFASALILCMNRGGWEVGILDSNPEELPYVDMTVKMLNAFPRDGGSFSIEPDASSGSYFMGAGWLLLNKGIREITAVAAIRRKLREIQKLPPETFQELLISSIVVQNWPTSHWQLDDDFGIFVNAGLQMPCSISRLHDLADSIMTAIALAPLNEGSGKFVKFTNLGRLRVQECERVVALRTELTKCGAEVVEEGDTLTVYPSKPDELHGAEIETYNDHRMAMCFAILGLKVPGIKIKNPACVKKTFPNFFQKLAGVPPQGLGTVIWEIKDGRSARQLSGPDLFAD